MPSDLSDADRQSIETDLRAGRMISAIKTYREATGTGLKVAKDAVEAMAAGLHTSASGSADLSDADRDAIHADLFASRKIPAIKTYRAATGAGLKAAKDAVEAMEAQLRASSPGRFTEPPAKGGCLPMLLLALPAPAALAALFWR